MIGIYYLLEEGQNKLDLERAWEDFTSKYTTFNSGPSRIISLKEKIFHIYPGSSNLPMEIVSEKGGGEIEPSSKDLWKVTTTHRTFHIHKKGLINEEY